MQDTLSIRDNQNLLIRYNHPAQHFTCLVHMADTLNHCAKYMKTLFLICTNHTSSTYRRCSKQVFSERFTEDCFERNFGVLSLGEMVGAEVETKHSTDDLSTSEVCSEGEQVHYMSNTALSGRELRTIKNICIQSIPISLESSMFQLWGIKSWSKQFH